MLILSVSSFVVFTFLTAKYYLKKTDSKNVFKNHK